MRRWLLLLPVVLVTGTVEGARPERWQQRVRYQMEVTLDPATHRMRGWQRLLYYNHSPDTLRRLFYHLYFNAFQPGSMMDVRNRTITDPDARLERIRRLRPEEYGWHRVRELTQDGSPVSWRLRETVLEVTLNRPLAPGDSTVLEMRFESQVPLQIRRSGRHNAEGVDYSMAQWYPKLVAYDAEGWHPDPYVGREFYGIWGDFEVKIRLPAHYVVGATGVLQNPQEVGHGYAGDPDIDGRPRSPQDTLTWHFLARNVHDFAWVADPEFRHEVVQGPEGIRIHLLYLPEVAPRWRPMRQWVPRILEFCIRTFGPYPYPQLTVAQAGDGGMEYPNIVFITGRRSPMSLLGVTVHEIVHNWFYGLLANNESREAWLDEGFTSWATQEGIAYVLGLKPDHTGSYVAYLRTALSGLEEPMALHSDHFATHQAYTTAAYAKGAVIVEQLRSVIGPEAHAQLMRRYYEAWRFRHPTARDFARLAERVSGMELDWYFMQWLYTTRKLDYAVEHMRRRPLPDGRWAVEVRLRNRDLALAPVDLALRLADGSIQRVHIPQLIQWGHRPLAARERLGDPWRWTDPVYVYRDTLPARPVRVELDPELRLPDYNRLNNVWGRPGPVRWSFLEPVEPGWRHYHVAWRPAFWYASHTGLRLGLDLDGAYLFGDRAISATAWIQSGPLRKPRPGLEAQASASRQLSPYAQSALRWARLWGIMELRWTAQLRHSVLPGPRRGALELMLTYQHAPQSRFRGPGFQWEPRQELTLGLALQESDRFGGGGRLQLEGSNSGLRAMLWRQWVWPLGQDALIGRLLAGSAGSRIAAHKRFLLGLGTPEAQWRNAAYAYLSNAGQPILQDSYAPVHGYGPVGRGASRWQSGTHVLSASLSYVRSAPLGRGELIRPLRLELMGALGALWNGSWRDRLRSAAGWQLEVAAALGYRIREFARLSRWVAQSELLRTLEVTVRLPLLAGHLSEPVLKVQQPYLGLLVAPW
ncbi:MAG: M1 family metallopeptidase [Bacteroidetes bacterium]|nr:M1 family metallopeptidase [Rhodothermia bacterium]MCS7154190.1 M1 family metallopeptidase [Bacteroidota bacterium]MCX7906774.1 M1 family metallopeptidase [Bacteroidota bacterium]MDW8136946.1 M1 family metallopeptidase [Bacteroidota bacterium]MDW8285183.1 M1 family metallopeptidase [Bacteroidota bacterium]